MPKQPPATRQLVSLQAAAEHLGVTVQTVRQYIAAGRVTAYRVGPRLLRVDLAQIESTLIVTVPTVGSVA